MMLYLGGADVIGHRFWRYWRPEAFDHPPGPRAIAAFGRVLPDYYRHLDASLGELTAGLDGWNVLLLSDHGMQAFQTKSPFDGSEGSGGLSGHHRNAPPGVLVASGPGLARPAPGAVPRRRTDLRVLGTVFDVAPTVLALLELPPAEDLAGRPLEHLFTPQQRAKPEPEAVPSYDLWFEGAPGEAERRGDEQERLEQLRSLGYLDGG